MTKFLLKIISTSILATPPVAASFLEETLHSNLTDISRLKQDISDYKIKDQDIFVKKNENDINQLVFLTLMENNPEYSDFLAELIFNKDQYIISGADFETPFDDQGHVYHMIILAKPSNLNFTGYTSINVKLFPEFERADLSNYQDYFTNNESKMPKIKVKRSTVSSTLEIKVSEIITALDKYFETEINAPEWLKNGNLLEQDKNNLVITDNNIPLSTVGYSEATFRIKIQPNNNSKYFISTPLVAYIKVIYDFDYLNASTSHSFNMKLSANWSTVNKWYWENNGSEFTTINAKDYVTKEELQASQNDVLKAFSKKFSKITFNTSGYGIDYSDVYHMAADVVISTVALTTSSKYRANIIEFKKNGFGTYSEVDLHMSVWSDYSYNIKYSLFAYVGVQGFGAVWQETALFANVYSWSFTK